MNLLIDNMLFYGLLLFAFISCLSNTAQTVVAIFLLLCFVAKAIIEKRLAIFDDSLTRAIGLFFAAVAVSVVFAINKQTGIETWFNYLYRFSIFFIAAFSLKTRKQVRWILFALAVSIVISDIYAVWQWLNGMARAKAFFSNDMIFAGCLVIVLPILFIQTVCNRKYRCVFILASLLTLFALIINQTRGAWIAVAFTLIIGCILLRRYYRQITIYLIALLIPILLFFSFNHNLSTRVQTIFDMQNQSNSERVLLWNSAAQMLMDYPITGVGPGNFREQYISFYISPAAKDLQLSHAHNNFLHIFAETGIIGGAAFLYMFFMVFKKYYAFAVLTDPWESSMAITGILVTFALLLQGITEYNLWTSVVTRLFWFVSGVIYASLQIKEDPEEGDELAK